MESLQESIEFPEKMRGRIWECIRECRGFRGGGGLGRIT